MGRSTLVTLIACVFFPMLATAAQGADCKICHVSVDHRDVEQAGDACAVCHDAVSHVAVGGKNKIKLPISASNAASAPTMGMSVALYYSPSRLGPAPSPMVRVPVGAFTMGTDERLPDEGPAHQVTLDAFDIDVFEVTNLQYQHFIEQAGRRAPDHFASRQFPSGKADHPVTFVTWFDAQAYCQWAEKRLPTDQEWEKAARGSDGRTFPWGNDFKMHAANTPVRWGVIGQEGDTTPVGAFADGVSPYGLFDVSGNVWEWTGSWYLPYPGNNRDSENYGEKYRTLKGGSWWDCSFYQCGISAPVFNRSFFSPKVKNATFGFRCARDVTEK